MKRQPVILLLAMAGSASVLHAGSRSSTNYRISADILDAGGRRATAPGAMTNDGSIGAIAGFSSVAAPAETLKSGYIAQLADVTGLILTSDAPAVNEGTPILFIAKQTFDDGTSQSVSGNAVAWSVTAGPMSINNTGTGTAGIVFQNTPATVQGIFGGRSATLEVTVVNTLPDNFQSYAGDGLDDDWQVQFFGEGNPNAGPLLDPDLDGYNNQSEFVTGTSPVDPNSRLQVRIEPVAGNASQRRIIFAPRLAGRSYFVESSFALQANGWNLLTNATQSDNGSERTVTDLDAGLPRKFYRVTVTKP